MRIGTCESDALELGSGMTDCLEGSDQVQTVEAEISYKYVDGAAK